MLIVFGVGHRTKKENELRELTECMHCRNRVKMRLVKEITWFSLFFIPVVPVETAYYKSCPVCRNAVRLDKSEYDRLLYKAL